MNEYPADGPPPGYASRETRKCFIIIACVLVGLCFIGQRVLPVIAKKLLTPHGILGGVEVTAHQVNNSAVWNGRVWYVQNAASLDEKIKTKLIGLELGGLEEAHDAASLAITEPWLVAGNDRLWIVSDESVAYYKDGRVEVLMEGESLGEVSRPFMYGGKVAVIEKKWPGHCLKIFENGKWIERASFKLGIEGGMEVSGEKLQAFESEGKLHLFCQPPGLTPVSYREGLPEKDEEEGDAWEVVTTRAGGQWKAASLGGKLALFYHDSSDDGGLCVTGIERNEQGWEEFFSYPIGLDIGMGICPTGAGKDFVLLRRILPIGTEVIGIKDAQPDWRYEQKGGLGLLQRTRILVNVPRVIPPVLVGLLAVVLSLVMGKYKVREYAAGETVVQFASLLRRGVAVVIDIVLVIAPFLAFAFAKIQDFLNAPFSFDGLFAVIGDVGCMGLIWFPFMFFLFSLLEGSWGRTPGKWIAGIRVVKTDLQKCGFGRALLRNLIRIVDIFWWYLVGILIVSLSVRWQRLGDLAAGTVVIRNAKGRSL